MHRACDEVCGYKDGMTSNVNTWLWNSGKNDVVQGKKKHIKKWERFPLQKTKFPRKQLLEL